MMDTLLAASRRLTLRYVLAYIIVFTVVHAVLPLSSFFLVPGAIDFLLAYVLLKLVSGLDTKDHWNRAMATYFLAVFKAVDIALLAENGFSPTATAAGEDEGRGGCHDEEGELHAWEWIDGD